MNGSFSPFRFAAKLAESSGNHARELPSGGSLIFNTSESNPVYTPADILSWVRSKPKKSYSCIEVVYGKSGDNFITIEPSMRKSPTDKKK